MDTVFNPKDLKPGTMYTVQWKQQAGNYQWYRKIACWQFVGPGNFDSLVWSGRPVCGTQDMLVENFLRADPAGSGYPTLPESMGRYLGELV